MTIASRTLRVGPVEVRVFPDRAALGRAAAAAVADRMREAPGAFGMVFASAASQVEFLAALSQVRGLPWGRAEAFHLDEYVGIPTGDRRAFAQFLRERILDGVKPAAFHALDGTADPEAECRRYEALLRKRPLEIACVGIGENGHLAFNDPHVADFREARWVKVVEPDLRSRKQQVADGCFARVEDVPLKAYTLTIPAILSARHVYCMVPGARKAEAVRRTLHEAVSTDCPATVLRTRGDVTLLLDEESGRGIDTAIAR
jgi:glucosamine-6-phosphate deaminase